MLARAGRRLLLLAAVYAAWLAAWYLAQERAIFAGAYLPQIQADPPPGTEQVWLSMPDGVRVEAWYKPGHDRSADSPGPAALFLHGNLDRVDEVWWRSSDFHAAGVSFLAVEYRGFGRSGGRPSEAALIADSGRFREWLLARPEVDPSRLILLGQSLGGAVAIALAAEQPPAVLLLECTFTSMAALGNRFLLPDFICRHPFRSDRCIGGVRCPILIVHGTRDWMIPIAHGRALARLARDARLLELDSGHRRFPQRWDAFENVLREAGVLAAP